MPKKQPTKKSAPREQVRESHGAVTDQDRAIAGYYNLFITGKVPAKKNSLQYRMGKGRGLMYRGGVGARLDQIALELRTQWQGEPLGRAVVWMDIEASSRQADGDGVVTTVLDALKKAGVIADDNMKRIPVCGFSAKGAGADSVRVRLLEIGGCSRTQITKWLLAAVEESYSG